jgi:Uma2 family endonuclease
MTALTLNLRPTLQLTNEEFEQLCHSNPELRLERSATGGLIVMPPVGSEGGSYNADLSGQLWLWNRQNQLGVTFDSSAGFTLPSGAIRSPDASWIEQRRWNALSAAQRRKFAPICPDFVIELKSPSDEWGDLQTKMQEYIANGAQLGWLIDPETKEVEIYRPDRPVERLKNPTSLSGEDVLPGFTLNLQSIFD